MLCVVGRAKRGKRKLHREEKEKCEKKKIVKEKSSALSVQSSRAKLNDTEERTVNDDEALCEKETLNMKRKPLERESNESNISTVINKQITKFVTPPCDLLHWQDMPQHLQFNPYVRKGELLAAELLMVIRVLNQPFHCHPRISTVAEHQRMYQQLVLPPQRDN